MRARPEGLSPYLDHDGLALYQGHSLELLRAMAAESVDACFTSPPFYGLRDYGGSEWEGGEPDCDHGEERLKTRQQGRQVDLEGGVPGSLRDKPEIVCKCGARRVAPTVWGGDPHCAHAWGATQRTDRQKRGRSGTGGNKHPSLAARGGGVGSGDAGNFCSKCGAWRGALGLEPDLFLYLDHLVEVFREVRRVLKPWGILLLEIGDSYASKERGSDEGWAQSRLTNPGSVQKAAAASLRKDGQRHRGKDAGIKEKDRMGVPHRLVFALVDDGWHWPGEIVWSRGNPMPSSTDRRCTDQHSMIFQLAKSGVPTYWTHRDLPGSLRRPKPDYRWIHRPTGDESSEPQEGREWRRVNLWTGNDYLWDAAAISEPAAESTADRAYLRKRPISARHEVMQGKGFHGKSDSLRVYDRATRNARSVWTVNTESHGFGLCAVCRAFWERNAPDKHCGVEKLGHFAAFPVALAEKAILAASSERGVCGECGAPWTRAVEKGEPELAANTWSPNGAGGYDLDAGGWVAREAGSTTLKHVRATVTTGWRPLCACGAAPVPSVVLDPFCGSGTVLVAARRLRRAALGLELNADYCEITGRRLAAPDIVERAADTSEEPVQLVLGSGE